MAMGQDPKMVAAIVSAVKAAVDVPVIPKLTPNVDRIEDIGRAALQAGADGLCAINTVGPGYTESHGHPILSNGMGGMSGGGVLPTALKCIRALKTITDKPIIGCGGLSTADDCRAAMNAGASIVGVGSALSGMDTQGMNGFFRQLQRDLETGGNKAKAELNLDLDMDFSAFKVMTNEPVCDDITVVTLNGNINIQPGEYVFVWIPGVGEKPFSCLTDAPLRLAVIDVGQFTHACYALEPGDNVYIRGPHGAPVMPKEDANIICVAGGTGLAAVYQVARDFGSNENPAQIFAGARSADRLYFIEECKDIAEVHIATDDGSTGFSGRVTNALRDYLETLDADTLAQTEFYNCGPEPMIHAAEAVQRDFVSASQMFSAIDYTTKCGVGICGACASPDGRRICVDGPFISTVS
jgi:dihydroorotate dehydrogenase (NAD+) catalytic subunit